MAFGLGFDKAKILQTAEKYVIQGKIPDAIAEYKKILKRDPKDLMTLNTVGDLYARAGKTEEAVRCFYELAEKSVEAGSVPRAIAVYKRITKLDAEALQALVKLGELYSMQGLMRDARTHYLQAVEIHARRRDLVKAREIFEKVLLLDMDNPRLQRRMANLYAETGKPAEAAATYLSAAGRFLETNEPAEAANTVDALLKLEPRNAEAKSLLGRLHLQQGELDKAVETLQSLPSLSSNKGALNTLFHAFRRRGDAERAREIARQLFDQHEDFAGLALVSEDLLGRGAAAEALAIYQQAAGRLQGQGAGAVLKEGLRKVLTLDSSNAAALELLWNVCRQAGDLEAGREIGEQLAQVYQEASELEKAHEVYAELVALEPDNREHRRLLRDLEARMGGGPRVREEEVIPEAVPLMAMEVAAPEEEQATRVETLPPREQALVKNWLTESELYINYYQIPRAIETLENGLLEVPGNLTLCEHLLPLYERTQQYQKAAKCAEVLTEAYVKLGDGERATRYGELIVGYQQKSLEMGAAPAGAAAEPEAAAPAEAFAPSAPAEQSQVREIDLSMEWASLSETASPATATPAVDSMVEEIEFYLQAGLTSEASAALEHLREQAPTHPSLAGFQERLGTPAVVETVFAETAATEETATIPGEQGAAVSETLAPEISPAEMEPEPLPVEAVPEAEPTPPAAEPEPELVLDNVVGAKGSDAAAPSFELALEEASAAEMAPAPQSQLAGLAGELEKGWEAPAGSPPKGPRAAPPAGAPAAAEPSKGFLDDVFAEFKEEVEEPAAAGGGDIETHYNMGVAFKEMALYDEAIGEFQKVHQLAEQAKDYSHVVQCCSLLATCFLEKGMPQLAVQWYQTALNSPGVDPESSTALLYEIGAAYETAGDRPAALKSFMEVYGRNIDYRHVAERIRDLQQNP